MKLLNYLKYKGRFLIAFVVRRCEIARLKFMMRREKKIFKYLLYGNKLVSVYYQPKIKKYNGGIIEKTIDPKFANCNIKFKDGKINIIV